MDCIGLPAGMFIVKVEGDWPGSKARRILSPAIAALIPPSRPALTRPSLRRLAIVYKVSTLPASGACAMTE